MAFSVIKLRCLGGTQGCFKACLSLFIYLRFGIEKTRVTKFFILSAICNLYCMLLRDKFTTFYLFSLLYVLFFIVDYVSMQDKKLPENSIHDLAYDLVKALQ